MNNSKQTVLSIVGIAILVIAVVGVSFAFFTYSRTGTTNNVITTGSITFVSNNDTATALTLTNEFPQAADYAALSDSNRTAFQFTVTGTVPNSANTIYYGVYVVEGDDASTAQLANTYTHKFQPSDISVAVSATNTSSSGTTGVVPNYNAGAPLTSAVQSTGDLVAYGTVPNNTSGLTHTFNLKMYVNSSVTISDTDTTADYRAKAYNVETWPEGIAPDSNSEHAGTSDGSTYDDRYVYSTMYYTIKVRVDARDTTNGAYYTPAP